MSEAGLVLAARSRRTSRHSRAELVGAVLPASLFLGAASLLAAFASTTRRLDVADLLLVVAFAICSRL